MPYKSDKHAIMFPLGAALWRIMIEKFVSANTVMNQQNETSTFAKILVSHATRVSVKPVVQKNAKLNSIEIEQLLPESRLGAESIKIAKAVVNLLRLNQEATSGVEPVYRQTSTDSLCKGTDSQLLHMTTYLRVNQIALFA
jgi:hypothetical protein